MYYTLEDRNDCERKLTICHEGTEKVVSIYLEASNDDKKIYELDYQQLRELIQCLVFIRQKIDLFGEKEFTNKNKEEILEAFEKIKF